MPLTPIFSNSSVHRPFSSDILKIIKDEIREIIQKIIQLTNGLFYVPNLNSIFGKSKKNKYTQINEIFNSKIQNSASKALDQYQQYSLGPSVNMVNMDEVQDVSDEAAFYKLLTKEIDQVKQDLKGKIGFKKGFDPANDMLTGICCALSLHFISEFFIHMNEPNLPNLEDLFKQLCEKFSKGGSLRDWAINRLQGELRSDEIIQDFLKDKSVGILAENCYQLSLENCGSTKSFNGENYFDYIKGIDMTGGVENALKEMKLAKSLKEQDKINQTISSLKDGVYFVSLDFPNFGVSTDKHGHAIVYIQYEGQSFLWDSNFGGAKIPKGEEAKFLHLSFGSNQQDATFFQCFQLPS